MSEALSNSTIGGETWTIENDDNGDTEWWNVSNGKLTFALLDPAEAQALVILLHSQSATIQRQSEALEEAKSALRQITVYDTKYADGEYATGPCFTVATEALARISEEKP